MLSHWFQAIYGTLKGADFLQERETEQLYSEALGKFLADRFVCGTCPKCGYEVRSLHSIEAHFDIIVELCALPVPTISLLLHYSGSACLHLRMRAATSVTPAATC